MNVGNKISSIASEAINPKIKIGSSGPKFVKYNDLAGHSECFLTYFVFPNGKKVYDMTSALEEAIGIKVLDLNV